MRPGRPHVGWRGQVRRNESYHLGAAMIASESSCPDREGWRGHDRGWTRTHAGGVEDQLQRRTARPTQLGASWVVEPASAARDSPASGATMRIVSCRAAQPRPPPRLTSAGAVFRRAQPAPSRWPWWPAPRTSPAPPGALTSERLYPSLGAGLGYSFGTGQGPRVLAVCPPDLRAVRWADFADRQDALKRGQVLVHAAARRRSSGRSTARAASAIFGPMPETMSVVNTSRCRRTRSRRGSSSPRSRCRPCLLIACTPCAKRGHVDTKPMPQPVDMVESDAYGQCRAESRSLRSAPHNGPPTGGANICTVLARLRRIDGTSGVARPGPRPTPAGRGHRAHARSETAKWGATEVLARRANRSPPRVRDRDREGVSRASAGLGALAGRGYARPSSTPALYLRFHCRTQRT